MRDICSYFCRVLLSAAYAPRAPRKPQSAAADAAANAASPLSPEALQTAVAEEVQKLVMKEGISNPELEGVITEQMVGAVGSFVRWTRSAALGAAWCSVDASAREPATQKQASAQPPLTCNPRQTNPLVHPPLQKKILDRAKALADEQAKEGGGAAPGAGPGDGQKQALRQDFENLLNIFFMGERGSVTHAILA